MPQHTEADDRKLSEHLRWEGKMFRLLVDNVKDYAIFIIDEERHITTWTKGAEHLLGYSESEILGKQLDIFFTPEDLASSTPAVEIRTAMEFGRGEDDRWHVRKDGSQFWCSGVVTPLLDETGCLRGFAKIMRDLTQKKAAEDKLAASDARFRRLLESNIIGMGVISDDGRIIEANDEYLRIVGYTREQLQAGDAFWTKATPSEYRSQDEAAVAQATKHGACTLRRRQANEVVYCSHSLPASVFFKMQCPARSLFSF